MKNYSFNAITSMLNLSGKPSIIPNILQLTILQTIACLHNKVSVKFSSNSYWCKIYSYTPAIFVVYFKRFPHSFIKADSDLDRKISHSCLYSYNCNLWNLSHYNKYLFKLHSDLLETLSLLSSLKSFPNVM